MIRLFVCDDHRLFREGLKKLLELEKDIKIVGEATNGLEAIENIKKTKPDIVLMDIAMPGMDGLTATAKIKKLMPNITIVILTIYDDQPHIFEAIKAGALGYVLKDISCEDLIESIRKAYKGEVLIQPSIACKVLKEFALLDKRKTLGTTRVYNDLTDREMDVLKLIALGGANKEIANKLNIREKTVKNHVSNIFQKLHVNNRVQAALYALDKKIS